MQEKKSIREDKTIVIDIKLTRWVVLIVVAVMAAATLFAFLAFYRENAQAATTQDLTSGMRHYYLEGTHVWGLGATTACGTGYHMASLWEIADPSNLKYDTTNGYQRQDSGEGPPAGVYGWVRTGYLNNHSSTVGRANCDGWTIIGSASDYGTRARLPDNWTAGFNDLGVWDLSIQECNLGEYVWCVED
jgi:hypothetical protein